MRADRERKNGSLLVYRHPLNVRVTHWVNAISLLVMLFSGLQILCAHPAFYLGEDSRFSRPLLAIETTAGADGASHGDLRLFGWRMDTTGVLGAVKDGQGQVAARAIPGWATLPSELDLGAGRRWHFFFAWIFALNGLAYLAFGLVTGRFQRVLAPRADELRTLGHVIVEHVRLRFPRGEAARRYNVLQKLSYLPIVFGLMPLMVLTGLAMSPAIDARMHLNAFLGGRQTARTLHFLSASGLVLFVGVHVGMVVLAGPFNELRSMITGWFIIRRDQEPR